MSRREMYRIIAALLRAYRRPYERISTEMSECDDFVSLLRRYNVQLSSATWDAIGDMSTAPVLPGQCLMHEAQARAFREAFSFITDERAIEAVVRYNCGHIWYNVDGLVLSARCLGLETVEELTHYVVATMYHERRHAYQPGEIILQQCADAGEVYLTQEGHDAVLCEQDANNWGLFQAAYQLCGRLDGNLHPVVEIRANDQYDLFWDFMGE